ncbi:MAG: epoxyqueuosine reductase [Deltaproteobacteria bacterium]|jgi:epoxyqueuosine reductase|nr:epoxyqueuosine reductase [Deltaproteobacteria bacterium]
MGQAEFLREKALELGFADMGIVRLEALRGLSERLAERSRKVPFRDDAYGNFGHFVAPRERRPWAQALIVVAIYLGRYRIPPRADGYIGKLYLTDFYGYPPSPDYQRIAAYGEFLAKEGIRAESDPFRGLTALRYAAQAAGLGLIRQNNFFYGAKGSFYRLEAWAIDRELELRGSGGATARPCPANCLKCVQNCPSRSLSEPFTMNMGTCVSYLSSVGPILALSSRLLKDMGGWLYGCDACQDRCPFNKGQWEGVEEFPLLEEVAAKALPGSLLEMSYAEIQKTLSPKFSYIVPELIFRWKLNALNVIDNLALTQYLPQTRMARADSHPLVREKAAAVARRLAK